MLLGLLLHSLALAQDVPTPDGSPVPENPAEVPVPARYGDGWYWSRVASPSTIAPLTGLAVGPGGWLAGDGFGSVFLSSDQGHTWHTVLEGRLPQSQLPDEPSDEKLLQEAQQHQSDEAEQASGDNVDLGAATSAAADLALKHAGERGLRGAAAQGHADPWWSPSDPTVALVARGDGLWRSRDGGEVFEQMNEQPASTLLISKVLPGAVVAGTDSGVLYSFDQGGTWDDVEDATDGGAINALAEVNGYILAGGDQGLFRTKDAFHWEKLVGLGDNQVQAILPDPSWDGGFWVATGSTLLRTDDGGQNFYTAGRQPMRGLRGLKQLSGPHLLAWGDDGVWESTDGGVRWSPLVRLLTEPDVRDLVVTSEGLVIATASGLWRLQPQVQKTEEEVASERVLPLPVVVNKAWNRSGLNVDTLGLSRRQLAALLTPSLLVDFEVGETASRKSSWWDQETTESHSPDWSASLQFCWGGCTASGFDSTGDYYESGGELYDADGNVLDPTDVEGDLFVVDGEVFDSTQVVAAAANVAESVQKYEYDLYGTVAEAWLTRSRLVAERPQVSTLSLQAQVNHELKIQELEARLDIYTDGAFRANLQDPKESR